LSQREALGLHSEVKALQQVLGISYKDACHRLYMAEVEKLKREGSTHSALVSLKSRLDDILQRQK
jgi:predicted transcriptional regulator